MICVKIHRGTTIKFNRRITRRGFALVITISLMVLLTVLCLGLLSLSAICLRSTQRDGMSVAQANARMALMLALGELQQSMGPDKAVSATSDLVIAEPYKPNLTGVWQSWNYNPDAPNLNYSEEKGQRFQRWLVSDADRAAPETLNYPAAPYTADSIELVGKGSLGGLDDHSMKVNAGRVPVVRNGKRIGSYAWHVADESVKARVNSYRDPSKNQTLAASRALVTGHRPDPSVVKSSDQADLQFLPNDDSKANYDHALMTTSKLIDLNQLDLMNPGRQTGRFRNMVTPYSLGVMSDVRHGGLKHDLTSMFESDMLPPEYAGQQLYASTHGISGVSDPNWSKLASYHKIYKKITNPDSAPSYNLPPQEAISLEGSHYPLNSFYPGPVIAKIEVLFTFISRDAHHSSPGKALLGHLIYAPLVTLHNPYNISVSFDKMQVMIRNVPVGFNFTVNGSTQNKVLTPLCEMFILNFKGSDRRGEKSFAMNIANWSYPTGDSIAGPIVLKPGQTLVCGPYLDPNLTWGGDHSSFDDWTNNKTGIDQYGNISWIRGKPGFAGKALGFDIDWLTPKHLIANSNDNEAGVLGLKPDDMVSIEFGIRQPHDFLKNVPLTDRFQVTASIVDVNDEGKDVIIPYGGLDFQYGDAATLEKYFGKTFRFPQQGAFAAKEAYHSNRVPIKAQGNAKAFALFSAYARTTNGGVFEANQRNEVNGALNVLRDGRLAGKPYLDHNPASSTVKVDLQRDVPGLHSHELNMVYLPGHAEDVFEIDAENRNYVVTGNTTTRGLKSGTYLELPTGPMMTIADFRRSNALTTPYLPNLVQPIANSRVSPLISTDKVRQRDVTNYPVLDHSVLGNHAFYDKFYFSTIAEMGKKNLKSVFSDFIEGKEPLWSQAFQAYLPGGKTPDDATAEIVANGKTSRSAYQLAAEYQLLKGPFNVNSTSVQAWKAVLSSLNKSQIPILWCKSLQVAFDSPYGTPVMPMSLVNGGLATTQAINPLNIDNFRTNQWNGYRELSGQEVEKLAEAIVAEVRARGPFLSLSEFVNRRIGANSELTRKGALEAALEEAKTNAPVFVTQVNVAAVDVNKPLLYRNKTIENAVGNPAEGAPGWITQGDLMRIIEPFATVRSDTFVIRSYGEARDVNGKVTARAYAEAVVQRIPDYLDPVDRPSVNVNDAPNASVLNKSFGRRIRIASFRWLPDREV